MDSTFHNKVCSRFTPLDRRQCFAYFNLDVVEHVSQFGLGVGSGGGGRVGGLVWGVPLPLTTDHEFRVGRDSSYQRSTHEHKRGNMGGLNMTKIRMSKREGVTTAVASRTRGTCSVENPGITSTINHRHHHHRHHPFFFCFFPAHI